MFILNNIIHFNWIISSVRTTSSTTSKINTEGGGEVGFNPTSGVRVLHTCTESDDQKRSCEIRFDRTVERRPTMRRKLKPTWLPFDDDTNFNNNNIANTLDRRYRYGNEFYCWKFLDLCSFVSLFFFFIPSYCPFAPFVYVSWFVYLFFFIFFYIFIFSFCLFVCYLSIFLRFGFVRKKERTLLPQHSFLLLVTMVASREGRMFFFYHFFLPSLSFLSFLLFSIVEILFPSFYMGWPRITARHVAKGLDDY